MLFNLFITLSGAFITLAAISQLNEKADDVFSSIVSDQ